MATVFISYAREDLETVRRLHEALAAHGATVWRDQDSLYGGQAWPKALGEAIAAQDFFLLCWSARAQASHFVELEWTTALALKKPIIPLRLDETPLPPSLRALNALSAEDAKASTAAVVRALERPVSLRGTEAREEVIRKLEALPGAGPEEVVREVQSLLTRERRKTTRIVAVMLAVFVLFLLGLLFDVPGRLEEFLESREKEHRLAGTITEYGAGSGLAGVVVRLTYAGRVQRDTTGADGHYAFIVRAAQPPTVSLRAEKDGYDPYSADPTLPNVKMDFQMRRRR